MCSGSKYANAKGTSWTISTKLISLERSKLILNSLSNRVSATLFKCVVSETTSNDFKVIITGITMVINYSMPKKMEFFISTASIYNPLGDSFTRFTKIIISTILFWTFTKINIIMLMFKLCSNWSYHKH